MIHVVEPNSPEQLDRVRELMRAFVRWAEQRYAAERAFVERYFSQGDFEAELAGLPGKYERPRGRLLLALIDTSPAGCVALRDLGGGVCEMKRLYVDPRYHGKGVGRALVQALVRESRDAGYRIMRLDTGPGQVEAQALYRGMGFRVIDPYYPVPNELASWLVFMELDLANSE